MRLFLDRVAFLLLLSVAAASADTPSSPPGTAPQTEHAASAVPGGDHRLVTIGTGDSVAVQVYGQPDLTATVYVSDDGSIPVGLVGSVHIAGLSPSEAGQRVEQALRDGNFLVNPHVSVTIVRSRSAQVTVGGEVKKPGTYEVESNTTVFGLLAEAGGTTDNSADVIYVIRRDKDGNVTRLPVELKGAADRQSALSAQTVQAGDLIDVPKALTYAILGEVKTPNTYRLDAGLTVIEAIARAGGITERGSTSRLQIVRRTANGTFVTLKANLTDSIQPNDVIRVRQSIF